MNLTIPYDYIEDRSQVVWTKTLAEVVRIERSRDGFKTNTATTRPCFECRDRVPISGSGAEPFPIATWLLHCEVFGSRSRIQLPLCSDHFKELRDKERELKGDGRAIASMEFSSGFDSDGSPWEPIEPVFDSRNYPLPRA